MRVDGDGVRIYVAPSQPRGARRLVVFFVVALVATAGVWLLMDRPKSGVSPADEASTAPVTDAASSAASEPAQATASVGSPPGAVERRELRAVHVSRSGPSREERREAAAAGGPEPELDAKTVIEALRASGETGGIAAFPPPGTDPVKNGIVVPDDFPLHEGYVRHYQTTDDGKRLDAILMFSPDYEFTDENGRPITLPEDGVVPPDMAPPDLPIRMLETPSTRGAGSAP